jgi:hypothetical protein
VPPNAFGGTAEIYASGDPVNHPLRLSSLDLASGLSSIPTGQVLIPQSLIEIVPTVGGVPFAGPLGSSVTLCLSYQDVNGDGIVDGTNPPIAVSSLRIMTLDTSVLRWVPLPSLRPLRAHYVGILLFEREDHSDPLEKRLRRPL